MIRLARKSTPADAFARGQRICCVYGIHEGHARDQALLLPASVEDYVAADNPVRVWMPPVLQGDFPTFWRLGAYIVRVSGLFAWLIVCHWPVCSSKNAVHIGSESYDARAPGLVSTS